MELSETKSSH